MGASAKEVSSPKGGALFFKWVNRLFDAIAAFTTFAIFAIVIVQVVGRLIGQPVSWTEEGTRFVFIWMVFLGVGMGFRQVESARVTYFLKWMPKFVRRLSPWIYVIGSVGFFLFMLFQGIELMRQQIVMNEMGSTILIPMWIIGLSIPVSSVLGILGVIESVIYHKELVMGGE